jgi:hypothetical protein
VTSMLFLLYNFEDRARVHVSVAFRELPTYRGSYLPTFLINFFSSQKFKKPKKSSPSVTRTPKSVTSYIYIYTLPTHIHTCIQESGD